MGYKQVGGNKESRTRGRQGGIWVQTAVLAQDSRLKTQEGFQAWVKVGQTRFWP